MADKKKVGLILSEARLKQRYPTAGAASNIIVPTEDQLCLPSSILALNWQYGGGIPYGTILEEFGEESTGKSLLAINFAVVAQALGGIVLWSDAEAVFRQQARFYQKMGLNLDKVQLYPDENIIEKISDWQADMIVTWRSKLKKNEPILLVTDSTAALETRDNMDAADSDSGEDMGRRSKKIYQMIRKRNSMYARYGVCVIYINQLRKKPTRTKYEDPDTTPGGKAMNFYASIRSGIRRGKKIVNADDVHIGQHVYFNIKKNKVAPPRNSVEGRVFFEKHNGMIGYDKYYGMLPVLTFKSPDEETKPV
jgi:recombination protein RecA